MMIMQLGWLAIVISVLGATMPIATNQATANERPLRILAAERSFKMGAAVDATALQTDPQYAAVLAREYNQLTPENVLKFGLVHPEADRYDWAAADTLVDFAANHQMQVHGHTLVWHEQLPDWVTQGNLTPAQARAVLRAHILSVVGRYKGKIQAWDVVNEAIDDKSQPRETIWRTLIGPEYIELAFGWAHEADPDAKLYYNDYGGEGLGPKSNAIYTLVSDLLARGVPIAGVGLQMHVTPANRPAPRDIATNLRRLAALGLQVHISELDVRLPTPVDANLLQRQANAYNDILRTCLAASNCTALTTWGFTDNYSWVPYFFEGYGAALPFDEQYQPKPAYNAMRNTLYRPRRLLPMIRQGQRNQAVATAIRSDI